MLAYVLGRWVAGVEGVALLAVVITSAAHRAERVRVRDRVRPGHPPGPGHVVLLSTVLSVPVLAGVAVLLGAP